MTPYDLLTLLGNVLTLIEDQFGWSLFSLDGRSSNQVADLVARWSLGSGVAFCLDSLAIRFLPSGFYDVLAKDQTDSVLVVLASFGRSAFVWLMHLSYQKKKDLTINAYPSPESYTHKKIIHSIVHIGI